MDSKPYWILLRTGVVFFLVLLAAIGFDLLSQTSSNVHAQTGLGGPIANLTSLETTLFGSGDQSVIRLWDPVQGLGPVFTQTRCNKCHGTPVDGGSSPILRSTYFGKIGIDGLFDPLLNEGGMLLQTFSVSQFKPGCVLQGEHVPTDATIRVKRLPPPLFGMGLIDSIPDQSIQDQATYEQSIGMSPIVNQVYDENQILRIGKFGYKAQAATLVQQSAGALQHDMGVTNPINISEDLPQGQPIPPNCQGGSEPYNDDGTQIMAIFHYLVYLAPAVPNPPPDGGVALFTFVGCDKCHHPTYTTGNQIVVPVVWHGQILHSKALSNQQVNLYSDLLVHDLARSDGIPMGDVPGTTGSQFRTAPLWGTSVKIANGIPFLHDGKATDVRSVIL